nr:recombinase family protein [Escherichia coli]
MLIGYARVSTQEQDTQAQISALKSAGCELIFQEKASGGRWDRPELQGVVSENGIYGHSRFCNTDFDDKLACLNLSGV